MIAETNGTVACCYNNLTSTTAKMPVMAWDNEGFALVADPNQKRLVRVEVWAASAYPSSDAEDTWLETAAEAAEAAEDEAVAR